MYKIILLLLSLSIQVNAFDVLNIFNLNGKWDKNKGEVSIEKFKFYTESFGMKSDMISVPLEKSGSNFYLNYKDTYFVYKPQENSILHGIEKVTFNNVSLNFEPKKILQFQTKGMEIMQTNGAQTIPSISLRCRKLDKVKSALDVSEDILVPCLDAASLTIPRIALNGFSASALSKSLNNKLAVKNLDNIKFNIYKGSYTLSLKAKYIFNWTIQASGTVKYLENTNQVELRLSKANAGIFPVKNTILKEIAASSLDSIKVIGDRILISL
jgi:hypothetical protein